jgi:dihydroorotate dehydrogenase
MKLHNIEFGPVHLAAGTGGFHCDGSEYWLHRTWFRPDFTGATKTAKTVTLHPRDTTTGANLPLDEQLRVTEWFPRCIAVNPILCCSVNAVGLANKGLRWHLDQGVWQEWAEPFFISLMAVGATRAERMKEWETMFALLAQYQESFHAPFAIQENFSCPNTEHETYTQHELDAEVSEVLYRGASLGVPQVPKFGVTQIDVVKGRMIGDHSHCAGIVLSNTIPWYDLPLWVRLVSFGTPWSPLRWRGISQPGGYAGPFLRTLVIHKIHNLRAIGFTKPIIACGGITHPNHVNQMRDIGADAIEFGTVAMLRPWRVQPIIERACTLTWR